VPKTANPPKMQAPSDNGVNNTPESQKIIAPDTEAVTWFADGQLSKRLIIIFDRPIEQIRRED
jgi:hypothetical protein